MNWANSVIDECDSTNDLARSLGEAGYPHGTWISARIQTRGRGRLGREWRSLEGNLFLSLVLRLESKDRWSWVPLMTAIAAARAIRELDPRLDVRIKWPNDLWLEGRKLGGILCEAVGSRDQSFIVAGIGINAARAPEGLDQETASLEMTADEIRLPIIASIRECADRLADQGPGFVAETYTELAALAPGMAIEWGNDEQGTVIGLGPSSELRVDVSGRERRLFAEDVKVRISRKASGGSRP
jgi:biotin-[acetyl-CoA-carboxylase] ligase BirA-like protein